MAEASRAGPIPRTWARPPSVRYMPSSTRIVVDFPAPLGPRKPWIWPLPTPRSRPFKALTLPKLLMRPSASMRSDNVLVLSCFLFEHGPELRVRLQAADQVVDDSPLVGLGVADLGQPGHPLPQQVPGPAAGQVA